MAADDLSVRFVKLIFCYTREEVGTIRRLGMTRDIVV